MEKDASVAVRYWVTANYSKDGSWKLTEPLGIEEFRKELAENYVSLVQVRPGGAGGLVSLLIDVVTNTTIRDLLAALILNISYDLAKASIRKFVLQPLIGAVTKLRATNPQEDFEISQLNVVFADAVLHLDSIPPEGLHAKLEAILLKLSERYESLALPSGELPFEIFIPVLEDTAADRLVRFRQVLVADETIRDFEPEMYFRFWGLIYGVETSRVYDCAHDQILQDDFWTRGQYNSAIDRKLQHPW